jgi:2-alkyl-3-oxoalkanoate reductase
LRVFLTGGTGLVGSHVADQLRASGHAVRALVRPASEVAYLDTIGAELIRGDMSSAPADLVSAMRGCDAIVHAAALVGARTTREHYVEQNVAGTRTILSAATAAGVGRAVHVSSVAVYGTIDGIIGEERWQEQPIAARAFYAWSKRAAEIEAWRHHSAGTLSVTTVRPALIYGERDRHVAARLERLTRLRVLPLVDGGRHIAPLVYAGNVARAIVAALLEPAAAGRAYNVAQDNRTPLRDFVKIWSTAAGHRRPAIANVPGGALEAAARGLDYLSARVPGIDLPGLTRPARLLRADNPYDSTRARTELGWTDVVPVEAAIGRTVAWLQSRDAAHT